MIHYFPLFQLLSTIINPHDYPNVELLDDRKTPCFMACYGYG
jgi:hypothetical protein